MSSSAISRGFVVCFFGFSAAILLPPLINFVLLWLSHETAPPRQIAQTLSEQKALYGTAVNANTPDLKLELVRIRRPRVVILGSSRALQFRQEMFTSSFSNAGGVMGELVDGLNFLRHMYISHSPELLILQLDHWWFLNSQFGRRARRIDGLDAEARITVRKVLAPFHWLANGSLNPSTYFDVITGQHRTHNMYVTYPTLGLQAIQYGRGFREDGSFLDARAWYDKDPEFQSRNFGMIRQHINRRAGNWSDTRPVDIGMFRLLRDIITFIKANDSSVAVLLAPLPEGIIRHMAETGRYSNVTDIRMRLKIELQDTEYYDFHDPKTFGGSDCEYLNGDHGGDVTSVRMLLATRDTHPIGAIAKHTDIDRLKKTIQQYRGRSFIDYDPTRYKFSEGDYLRLGCIKQTD